ncbi:UvrD-helicase domain-containing protein [Vibrio fluvialis]|nr:UvrD-helicase domain-containing protein [Vibrio fluvialis]
MSVEAVLQCSRGTVVAPAGCGKTHLITNTLDIRQPKPYLVLTHTTAGVAALKQRLRQLAVPSQNYVVATIDGWALRIARAFPGLCPVLSQPEQPNQYYHELRQAVLNTLNSGQLSSIVRASYSRLLVDEYQDCCRTQHQIVQAISGVIPTVVFGDPLQCIFNFNRVPMPDWDSEVLPYFPTLITMDTPWRWNNVGANDLGAWVLFCRQELLAGRPIDFTFSPQSVTWSANSGNANHDMSLQQASHYHLLHRHPSESVLIIGESTNAYSRHQFAQRTNQLDVVEPVDLNDMTSSARACDELQGLPLIESILNTFSTLATNVENTVTLRRINSISAGRNRNAATSFEQALIYLNTNKSATNILNVFNELEAKQGVRIYRTAVFSALKEAVSIASRNSEISIHSAAQQVRERRRHNGDKRIPHRAIGSTLLLKGLECDHALILDAGNMNPSNLYVALSRGARSVHIYSQNQVYYS